MFGVILYGPPASGKDTVTEELKRLDGRYRQFERLKSGSGRSRGYRMTTESAIDDLRSRGEVIWENRRYGALYVVDRPSLVQSLGTGIPVLHLGQVEAVGAVIGAIPDAAWLTVSLWCPRDVAATRLIGRGSTDMHDRLRAWDETEPLPTADLIINTAEISAQQAAQAINAAHLGRAGGNERSNH
ncbi:kinase [Thermomonospora cellulosilytica]|uniref:Guanylate kinase n=1 Tax=Thermomonospora cellulosilytica TaxID=1411118 RepID=A0A7W3MUE8_9ACTN|nr:kinase [Thermomonospora cellulosilytica]MBA9002065.1 guanylate kinase [Thermomonospora cellulosilytica]